MKRWVLAVLSGLLFTFLLFSVDLPFKANFFRFLLTLRGPISPNPNLALVVFDVMRDPAFPNQSEDEAFHQLLRTFLKKMESSPPLAIQLDFEVPKTLENEIFQPSKSFPIFSASHYSTSIFTKLRLPIISSPDFVHALSQKTAPDPFITNMINIKLIQALAPQKLDAAQTDRPIFLNILGPPKTIPRFKISDLLSSEKTQNELKGKIVFVSAITGDTQSGNGEFAFYPKGGAQGVDETELHANLVDNILNERGLKLLPPWVTITLTAIVSVFSVIVLFFMPPVVGILSMALLTIFLLFSSLVAIGIFYYLDIHAALFSVVSIYYLLIPYRLIMEYQRRWQVEQESQVKAEVEILKDNFMSLVSHNLRTPIARIEGQIENLLSGSSKDAPSIRTELTKMLQSTEELNKFVGRILSLAQVERPDYKIRTTPKDVNELVEKVVGDLKSAAKEKELNFSMHLEPLFPVSMDVELIRESIANLVENAIKYTPSGGSVEVRTGESGNWIEVTVLDSGPGIHGEDKDKLFLKFYRGVEVKNKGIRGTGLGLYLVKYFIELHSGFVEHQNRPEGGSRFTIQLIRK